MVIIPSQQVANDVTILPQSYRSGTLSVYRGPKRGTWGRKRMTLIAAFRCQEGAVLCADTQETVGDVRVAVNKLKPQDLGEYELAVAGSGNGDLIESFTYSLEIAIRSWPVGLDEAAARNLIRDLLLDFHRNEVALYPADSADDKLNHFLVCVKPKNATDIFLWQLRGSAFVPVGDHTLIGIGASIYQHELARLYRPMLSANQAVLLGVHLFSLAKATSNYVGGSTDIIFIGSDGMHPHDPRHVVEMETKVALFNGKIAGLILACPDIALSEFTLEEMLVDFHKFVKDMRSDWTADLLLNWRSRIMSEPGHATDPYPLIARGTKAHVAADNDEKETSQ